MFAAQNDQENFVHGHQQVAASKPLNHGTRAGPPKTPGNKYPKTPLRVPLNDENAPTGYGKNILGTKKKGNENLMTGGKKGTPFGKNAFVTPMGNRAPLGMKTTNAKTKGFKTPGPIDDKEPEKTQPIPQSSIRRPKRVSHAETVKLEIHGDDLGPLDVPDVEYAPPKPAELPYESDVFPDGCLNYDVFKGKHVFRSRQSRFNPIDENGVSKKEKEHQEATAKALKEGEAKILKAMDEQDWSVGDVPETWPEHKQPKKALPIDKRAPSTLNARKAVAALSASVPSRPATAMSKTSTTTAKPKLPTSFIRSKKPAPPSSAELARIHAEAVATSRTTIGYSKGRATSAAIRPALNRNPISRSESSASVASSGNSTVTPGLLAKKQNEEKDYSHLAFLKAFDREDDESSDGLGGGLPNLLEDEEEEEFVMTLNLK